MAPEYSSRGQPERSMALLWRAQRRPTRGPKPGLTVDRIAEEAIKLADAEGLAGLSMRRVAEALDVAPMSLYTYVPGKAELLDVMLDTVYGETAALLEAERTESAAARPHRRWRRGLEARARADWALYQRHPWVLQLARARALLGPKELAIFEASLAMVAGLGLTGREMVSVVDVVAGHVAGAAAGLAQAAEAPQETGTSDEEWWQGREPMLEEVFTAERFPTIAAVDADGGFDVSDVSQPYNVQFAMEDFDFGLERLLDGMETFIARRRRSARTS